MLFTTVGSKASALPRRLCGALALVAVPIVLAGCVSGQQQSFASLAKTAAQEEVAMDKAEEAASRAPAATALAPVRNENGTISGSRALDQMIASAADANNIPRDLAFGVVHVESTYNPRARGRGVYGLSQIMPSTARSLGFSGSSEDLLEPTTNLRYGMRYLAGAWEKGGRDVCRASMKYKGGHRATTMTRSAAAYCGRVRQQMQRIAGNPILQGAPVALAANAPATAAVQVAAAPQAASPAAARVKIAAASPAAAPAANALASNTSSGNAATAAIEAAGRSSAAAAVAQPSPRPSEAAPEASAVAEAVAATTPAPAPIAAESLSLAAEPAAGSGEPDPSRFGG